MNSTRAGFGEGILEAGKDKNVVALTADLGGSCKLGDFIKKYPEQFIQVGVAEQNLVTVASGLAAVGKIPFATSFAAFSPGRNWEQIKTSIAYNNQPVIVVGSHTGLGVGPDGATHQMLEDIALMRVIPNMIVVNPCDFVQAKKATIALAKLKKPAYLRLARQKTHIIMNEKSKFEIGKAQVVREGIDLAIISSGPVLHEAILAAEELEKKGIHATVLNIHTIKPLDEDAILDAAKTGRIVTVEDHQIIGGLGSAVSELVHVPVERIGVNDRFGETGNVTELYKKHGITVENIIKVCKKLMDVNF